MKPFYVASHNAGKIAELRELFAGSPWEPQEFAGYVEVEETGRTYVENALLKARALHRLLRARGLADPVLADDSGLEVRALGGGPGVDSASFGGDVSWPARRAALLAAVGDAAGEERAARFVCTLAWIEPDGTELVVRGEVSGVIAECERGAGGFGYDPIFLPEGSDRTFAELSPAEKHRLSHRGRAVRALFAALRRRAGSAANGT